MPKKSNNVKLWRHGNRRFLIGVLGLILAVFGILCGMFWEEIFNCIWQKEMTLRPDSRIFDNWKNPPLSLNLDIYLFNWTNPEDFRNLSTKPILQQLGPYRFMEKPDKVDIKWHPENASVTYRKRSEFYFDAENSNGNLDDEIITLNPVALSAAGKAKTWGHMRRGMVDVGLKLYGQEVYVIKSVDEMLFSGYSDSLIDMARTMPASFFGNDEVVPFDRFGWFYTRNGSSELAGVFNMYTGADDIAKLGKLHSWNYKENTGFFESYCGMTNGSAGEFQPSNLEEGGSVDLFTPDMCRTVPLDYVETTEIEGVRGFKYSGGQRSVDNGSIYPENLCFCGGQCVPSGVMNISACRFGTPVFMSYPHFFNADPFYLDQVEGLAPNQRDHEFYMVLEPKTGLALEVAARFQVNMLIEPIESISLYEGIPRVFFPLIWFEQMVRITPELAGGLKMVPKILLIGPIFGGICFAVGLILLCWYPIEQLWSKYRSDNAQVKHPLAGKYQPTLTTSSELKSKPKPITAKDQNTPDSSPLLEKSNHLPQIIPKSNTADSAATVATALSGSPTSNQHV